MAQARRAVWVRLALGIALLAWSFIPVGGSWTPLRQPIELAFPNAWSRAFDLSRTGEHSIVLSVHGAWPPCAVAGEPTARECRRAPQPLDLAWRLTNAAGDTVSSGTTTAHVWGIYGSGDGTSGVILAIFRNPGAARYELAIDVREPAPLLVALRPEVRVEVGARQRETDLVIQSVAGVAGVVLLLFAGLAALRARRKSR